MKITEKALIATAAFVAAGLIGAAVTAGAPKSAPDAQSAAAPGVPAYSQYDPATAEYSQQWVLVNPNTRHTALSDQCPSLGWLSPLHHMRNQFDSDITLEKDATEDGARVVVFKHGGQSFVYTNSVRHCANMLEDGEVEPAPVWEPVAGR